MSELTEYIWISVKIPRELNQRFKNVCDQLVPKVNKSDQAHALIRDFVIKKEKLYGGIYAGSNQTKSKENYSTD